MVKDMGMTQKKYAMVFSDSTTQIVETWAECRRITHGVSGARFKSFEDDTAMSDWIKDNLSTTVKLSDVIMENHCIYVDGSYQPSKSTHAGWAFVHMFKGELIHADSGVTAAPAEFRNIDGEVQATVEALLYIQINKLSNIFIVHDYIGLSQWAKKLWKNNARSPLVESLQQKYSEVTQLNTEFVHVKGHTEIYGNTLADNYATSAVLMSKKC